MSHGNTFAAALIFAVTTALLPAQEPIELDLESTAALAIANAAVLVDLQRRVGDTTDALGWGAYRDALTLSLSGALSGDGSATIGAAVAVVPQLTVTGRLTGRAVGSDSTAEAITGSLGMTFAPFADAQGSERNRIAYDRAVIEFEAAGRSAAFTAISRLLDAVVAQQELELSRAHRELAERGLASLEALAEYDRVTEDEVESATDTLRALRQAQQRSVLNAERSVSSLAIAVGLAPGAIELPDPDSLTPEVGLSEIRAVVDQLSPDALADATQAVRMAALDVASADVEVVAARRFTPELSAAAQMELPLTSSLGQNQPRYSLNMDLTVQRSDWDGLAKREAREDLSLAERALESARANAVYSVMSAVLELQFAIEDLDAAAQDLYLARQDLVEKTFQFERGAVTELAFDESRLDVARAEAELDVAGLGVVEQWYRIDLGQF